MKPTRPVAIILEMFIHNAEWPAPANRLEFADDMLLLLLLQLLLLLLLPPFLPLSSCNPLPHRCLCTDCRCDALLSQFPAFVRCLDSRSCLLLLLLLSLLLLLLLLLLSLMLLLLSPLLLLPLRDPSPHRCLCADRRCDALLS